MTRARPGLRVACAVMAVAAAACSSDSVSDGPDVDPTTTTSRPIASIPEAGPWVSAREPGVGGRITDVTFDPAHCDVMLVAGDLLGAARSDDGGETWQQIDGLTGREVSRFTWDPTRPDVLWIATMSGPFVSTDGGRSVRPAREGMEAPTEFTYTAPVEAVLFDPAQPGRLLAFGGSHRRWIANPGAGWGTVWESTDDGSTWSEIGQVADNPIWAAAHTGSGWIASVAEVGVFVSSDGRTWDGPVAGLVDRPVSQFLVVGDTLWAAIASDTGLAGVASSTDGGRTWTIDDTGLDIRDVVEDGVSTSFESLASDVDGSVLYAGDVGFGTASVSARPSGEPSWTVRSTTAELPHTVYDSGLIARAMAVSPCDADTVLVGTDETLWLTDDGAVTWSDLSTRSVGDESWVGTGFSGMVTTGADVLDDGTLITTSLDGGSLLVRRTDGTWDRPLRNDYPFGGGLDVDARGTSAIVALGQNGVLNAVAVSNDSGVSWRQSRVSFIDGFPTEGELPVSVAAAPDGSWLLNAFGSLWRADDADLRWNRVDVGAVVHDVATSGDLVVLATEFGVMLSDATLRDTIPIGGPSSPVGDTKLTVTDDGTVLAVIWRDGDAGVWLRRAETDARPAWVQISDDPRARSAAIDPADADHIVVTRDDRPFRDSSYRVGVVETFDGGRTWADDGEGLPLERVSVVIADHTRPGVWLVGTHGSGWWESGSDPSGARQDG